MTSLLTTSTFTYSPVNSGSRGFRKPRNSCISIQGHCVKAMRIEKPLEELYNVKVERKVTPEKLAQLGVSKWSVWKTGKARLPWDWQVDQLVYIEEGEVRVVPEGSKRFMQFVAGDLIRYPKWFEADLWFNGPYQERYSFRAYGDDN
jgi:ethanolamine utilization protein EutQ (cupin superfamily)